MKIHCLEFLTDRDEKTTTDTELTRTSRRRHSADSLVFDNNDNTVQPAKAKGSRKKKGTRRHKKDAASDQEGSSSKASEDTNTNGEPSPTSPTARKLPDIPKKSRRKKVKDEISKIATKAKPKASADSADGPPLSSPAPLPRPPATTKTTDSGPGSDSTTAVTCDGESCRITLKSPPNVAEENS